MAILHLKEFSRGHQKQQPEFMALLSSVLIHLEGDSMLLRAVQVGGKHTHLETRTPSPLSAIPLHQILRLLP